MFKGISTKQFDSYFSTEERCWQYLYNLKMKKGFICKRCEHDSFWKGRTGFHRRCTKCDYNESLYANTAFEGMKLPLLKVFRMIFLISVSRAGVSTKALAEEMGTNQKTAWLMRRKVQDAMTTAITGTSAEVLYRAIDGITLTHRTGKTSGLQQIHIKLGKCRKGRSRKNSLKLISIEQKDESQDFLSCDLLNGKYDGLSPDIRIWNFRVWLTGTHHHCSLKYLRGYLSEFLFKLSNNARKDLIWHRVISLFINPDPNKFTFNGRLSGKSEG